MLASTAIMWLLWCLLLFKIQWVNWIIFSVLQLPPLTSCITFNSIVLISENISIVLSIMAHIYVSHVKRCILNSLRVMKENVKSVSILSYIYLVWTCCVVTFNCSSLFNASCSSEQKLSPAVCFALLAVGSDSSISSISC